MTSDDLFALPYSKRVARWLFRGEIREAKVTKRNPSHSRATARIASILDQWVIKQQNPRGAVYSNEAYFRTRKDPETNVGVDVALGPAEQVANTKKKASYVDGPPVLVIEVLSPKDKMKDINEAVEECLECGTKQVWIVDPYLEAVTDHRAGREPVQYTRSQMLAGGDDLPGFACPVAEIFE